VKKMKKFAFGVLLLLMVGMVSAQIYAPRSALMMSFEDTSSEDCEPYDITDKTCSGTIYQYQQCMPRAGGYPNTWVAKSYDCADQGLNCVEGMGCVEPEWSVPVEFEDTSIPPIVIIIGIGIVLFVIIALFKGGK
jgi:hypothetical protein